MQRVSSGACSGWTPIRDMPVSTARCTSAWAGRAAHTASRASTLAWSQTVRVSPAWTAAAISSGNAGESFRIGRPMPAARNCRPSGTVAIPSQSTPACSARRATATAPCPYALALTAMSIFRVAPMAARMASRLARMWSRWMRAWV